MIRALWTAASGMSAQQMNVDVISNNLANVNTPGFKRSRADFQDLLYQTLSSAGTKTSSGSENPSGLQVGLGSRIVSTGKIFSQGNFKETQNPLDLTIEGNGFFQLQMPSGEIGYTRSGNLKMSADGQLTNSEGWFVVPQITIPDTAAEISIGSDGTVSIIDGATGVAQDLGTPIELVRFANPEGLMSGGRSIYHATGASGEPIAGIPGTLGMGSIAQGYLEMSNVSVVEEMVNLIAGQRAYEISSKAIQASDEMLQTANNVKR
jgi:flagellar basal-body rod protein FlgG